MHLLMMLAVLLGPHDPPANARAMAPFLVEDGAGGAYLTWLEPAEEAQDELVLQLAHFEDGCWSQARTITRRNDFFANWADVPEIAVAGDGALVVAWPQKSGPGTYSYDLAVARSRDGGATWTHLGTLNDDRTRSEHGFVSMLPEGDGVRAWWLDGRAMTEEGHGHGGGDMQLRTARIGDAIEESVQLDPRTCECCGTDAAIVGGEPILVYRDRVEGEVRDISMAYGNAVAPVHDDGWGVSSCPVNGPVIAAIGDQAVVAWFTDAMDSPSTVRYVFVSTSGIAAPIDLSQKAVGRVAVAMLGQDNAMVCWQEAGGILLAATVKPDGHLEPIEIARIADSRAAGFPVMVRLEDGVLFAWTSPDRARGIEARLITIPTVPAD